MSETYTEFLSRKSQSGGNSGFEPLWMPDFLFDFQRHLIEWACRKGRAAIFADCGLGKTPMQLVWSENIVRKTNGRVLILTPLAVSHQTCREADKFGIECNRSGDGKPKGSITVTNYEQLHKFSPDDFSGVVCDESSIMKNFNGKRKAEITDFMKNMPYRLACTATAAPNDYFELGTSSEALGYLGYTDMITKFFKEEIFKDMLGWGRKTYRFRGHAEQSFWRWVCSWARVCRKPSDLGFSDEGFILPALQEHESVINAEIKRPGFLFSVPAKNIQDQREEARVSLKDRCCEAANLAMRHDGASVVWCHLNPEGELLEKMIPGARQVCGSMADEEKEEHLLAFQSGQLKKLVIKPKIGAFGLNWQHCNNVICFPSHSWERYYQAVRRCWRFGQKNPVDVYIVATEGEIGILKNLQRKATQADRMFTELARHAGDALRMVCGFKFEKKEELPSWL